MSFPRDEIDELRWLDAKWRPIAEKHGHDLEFDALEVCGHNEGLGVYVVNATEDRAEIQLRFEGWNIGLQSNQLYRWKEYRYKTSENTETSAGTCPEHQSACDPFPGGSCGWIGATTFDFDTVASVLGVRPEIDEAYQRRALQEGYAPPVARELSRLWNARVGLLHAMGWHALPDTVLGVERFHLVLQINRKIYRTLTKWEYGGQLLQCVSEWASPGGTCAKQILESQRLVILPAWLQKQKEAANKRTEVSGEKTHQRFRNHSKSQFL